MNKSERNVLLVVIILFLLGLFFWHISSGPKTPQEIPLAPVTPSTGTLATPVQPTPVAPTPVKPPVAPIEKPKPPHTKPVVPATTPNGTPIAPKIELHKELIPKNIDIVRCYYAHDVTPPGTTTGFDINGSGFTSEFQQMIKVESGNDDIQIKNLQLVTANQIHGDLVIGPKSKTGFVFPRVLIHGLPVFSAPDPFAVVRKGEVLTVFFVSMDENGRGGQFRVITNLDDALAKTFQVTASTPGIKISEIKPKLPFIMDGRLEISPGVPQGEYGLIVSIGGKEAFRKMGIIRIVRPNIGQSGFIQGLTAEERYHRPGDAIQIYVQATGLSAQDASTLDAKTEDFDLGKASFTYISPLQLRLTFNSPSTAPLGSYGVRIMKNSGENLYEKRDLFTMVPANWVGGVQVTPPVSRGGRSTLKIVGRDFAPDYASGLQITTDDPGITITNLRRADPSSLVADIMVSAAVTPGDYWLHLSYQGKRIDPPYGSIIKVEGN